MVAVGLLFITIQPASIHAQSATSTTPPASGPMACEDGTQESGATYRICMPASWNGKLLVYAHGYVAPTEPVGIPEDQLGVAGSPTVDQLANALGYAFVTSGYRANGLVVQEGILDLIDAVEIFTEQEGEPSQVLLAGVSEGGLIAALAVERHPDFFDGALAMCGPYGSFRDQIDYFGDFRALFDYFLPTVMPPSPVAIPETLIENWETGYYTDTVYPAITAAENITAVNQLLAVSGAAVDSEDDTTKAQTIEDLLWYNVFATNDATTKLGGQPYDNRTRVYSGSDEDAVLNDEIARFDADSTALDAMQAYETTGLLERPLITLHTTGDPIVPIWHAADYEAQIAAAGRAPFHERITYDNYGHCQFTAAVILDAFGRLTTIVDNPPQFQSYLPLVQR